MTAVALAGLSDEELKARWTSTAPGSAERKELASLMAARERRRAAPDTATSDVNLPDDFWTARPKLDHIRRAAHSRTCSADAVLLVVLTRLAAAVPHTLRLPAIVGDEVPLSLLVATVGPPASGKSSAAKVARRLAPVPDHITDGLPAGSGEGMAEALFEVVEEEDETGKKIHVKRQKKHNAIIYIDEGQVLTALGARSGSTVLPTLRSIFTGDAIGQTNASAERKRVVPAGSYTFGVAVSLQPKLAGDLLADHPGGTPQRFLWSWAQDPAIPTPRPAWPGIIGWRTGNVVPMHGEVSWKIPPEIEGQTMAVDPAIVEEIQAQHLAVQLGDLVLDPFEAHAMLVRLKVAGLLAILESRLSIDTEDWQLAGTVLDTSRAVRRYVQGIVADEAAKIEAATSAKGARREVEKVNAVEQNQIEKVARRVVEIVAAHSDEGISSGAIRTALDGRQRPFAHEAISLARDHGEITEVVSPGRGQDRRRWWLTESAP